MRRLLPRLFILLWIVPSMTFAQQTTIIPEGGGGCDLATGDIHFDCAAQVVGWIVEFLFGIIGTLCLLQIIFAGFQWAVSGALDGQAEKAKTRLYNAIFGLLVSIMAFAIVNFFVSTATG